MVIDSAYAKTIALVDTLSENWNQLETYVFDAYDLIRATNLGSFTNENAM